VQEPRHLDDEEEDKKDQGKDESELDDALPSNSLCPQTRPTHAICLHGETHSRQGHA
jgi:hypothetical protein